MNKIIKFLLMLIIVAVVPVISFAASFSFTPSSGEYTEGQTYNVSVFVEPNEETIYTAKVELKYPADLLEVKLFTFGSNWMSLNQPGYDNIDNVSGVLIKTGGYSGGLSNKMLLGAVSLYAKKTGSATVEVTNNSLILDGNSKNVLSGLPKASFTLVAKPAPTPAPQVKDTAIIKTPVGEEDIEEVVIRESVEEVGIDKADNLTAVSEAGKNTLTYNLVFGILIALLVFLAGFFVGRKTDFPNVGGKRF